MASINQERNEVADLLREDGVEAFGYIPSRYNPPLWMVTPGSPYIEGGDTFGSLRLRLVLTYVSSVKANANVTTELDAAIDRAIPKLLAASVRIESVGQPTAFAAGGAGEFTAIQAEISFIFTPEERA